MCTLNKLHICLYRGNSKTLTTSIESPFATRNSDDLKFFEILYDLIKL
jgi:hypothetical protein